MHRRTILLGGITAWALGSLGGAKAQTARDEFDALRGSMRRDFTATRDDLEARHAALSEELRRSFEEVRQEIARSWGEATVLPSPKTWVGYSEDQKTRVVVDYEAGQISVESVVPAIGAEALRDELLKALSSDSAALDRKDVLARRQAEKVDAADIPRPTPPPKGVIRAELAPLVAPGGANTALPSAQNIVGPQGRPIELSRLVVPMTDDGRRLNAERVRRNVEVVADHYGLQRSLVAAIIKQESDFNPRAVSPAPAYGLMQLVPRSGGTDAYSEIMGKRATPTPDLLFRAEDNIKLGATYLWILLSRQLASVSDAQSRLWCAISAYNTGSGNVAKAFRGARFPDAAGAVNALPAERVFSNLVANLPFDETRRYLPSVRRHMEAFRSWNK